MPTTIPATREPDPAFQVVPGSPTGGVEALPIPDAEPGEESGAWASPADAWAEDHA